MGSSFSSRQAIYESGRDADPFTGGLRLLQCERNQQLILGTAPGPTRPRPTFLYLGPSYKIQKFTSIIASLSAASYPGPTGELINIVNRWEKSEREGKNP